MDTVAVARTASGKIRIERPTKLRLDGNGDRFVQRVGVAQSAATVSVMVVGSKI